MLYCVKLIAQFIAMNFNFPLFREIPTIIDMFLEFIDNMCGYIWSRKQKLSWNNGITDGSFLIKSICFWRR